MAAHLCSRLLRRGCFAVRFSSPSEADALLTKSNKLKSCGQLLVRSAGDEGPKRMFIHPGSFQDWRAMRAIGFYALLTGLPVMFVITYINVFIGEATYSEIPEGYVPYHWEYHKHPITRFVAKYLSESPQMSYEKMAHYVQIEGEKIKERKLEKEVRKQMRQRGDGFWYAPKVKGPDTLKEDY